MFNVHKVQSLVKTNLKYFFKFINYRKDNNVIPTLMSYDPATADNRQKYCELLR